MKIICIDFDGVIHSYVSGWQGINEIPDPPVPGAIVWLRLLMDDEDYEVCIYSSRSRESKGIEAMRSWLRHWGMDDGEVYKRISFPTQKPAAYLTIDDRCITFRGTFPSIQEMDCFRPWTDGYKEEENQ